MSETIHEIEMRERTVEEIIELLRQLNPSRADSPKVRRERRLEVAERLEEQIRNPTVVGICGLPAAGKTTAATFLANEFGGQVVSMGDAIREKTPERFDSEQLADFASRTRENQPEKIPQWTAEMVDDDAELVVVEGVRSPTDAKYFQDAFENFYLLEVKAPFEVRLERIQERGREGEGDFDRVDLAERDKKELEELGVGSLLYEGEEPLPKMCASSACPRWKFREKVVNVVETAANLDT